MRAFAILGVVALHALNDTLWNYNKALFESLAYCLNYAVALFILISGFVLGLKYRRDFSLIDFYRKRASSVIPPYLVFSFLYMLPGYLWPESYQGYSRPFLLSDAAAKLLTGTATPHFWFFILIIKLYVLYPFVVRLIDSRFFRHNFLILFICVLLIKFCWIYFYADINSLAGAGPSFINRLILAQADKSVFFYLIYFATGIYISGNTDSIRRESGERKYIYLFFVVMFLFAFSKAGKSYFHLDVPPSYKTFKDIFLVPVLFILFYIFLYRWSVKLLEGTSMLKKIMIVIGKYSFGIYMVHLLVMYMMGPMLGGMTEALVWAYCLLYYAATIILSIFFLKLMSLLPYSEFAVGGNIGAKRRN